MKKLIGSAALFILLCFAGYSQNVQRVTLTITVTNPPVTSNSLTVNGVTRMWTNAEASATFLTNLTGINQSKTNIYRQITRWLWPGPLNLEDGGTNSFRLRAPISSALSASISGTWATLSLSTQSGPQTYDAVWPMENLSVTDRVNQASSLVSGLSAYSTNAFATNATAVSNVLNKGASPLQRVLSPVLFNSVGGTNAGLTNGVYKSPILLNPSMTNGAVSGYMIGSDGSGNMSWIPATGGGTNVGTGQSIYLDASFGNNDNAQRTNLSRPYLTASNAVAAMISGDTLIVRGGDYPVDPLFDSFDASLLISNKTNICIRGEPDSIFQLSSLRGDEFGTYGNILKLSRCTNVLIDTMTFRGFRTNGLVEQHFAVMLDRCDRVTFNNVRVLNWQNQGVTDLSETTQASNIQFLNSEFSDIGGTNQAGLGNDGAAISVSANNLLVNNCRFNRNLRDFELCCSGDNRGVVFANNRSEGCYAQSLVLEATNISNIQILNNVVRGYSTTLPSGVNEANWIVVRGLTNALIQGNDVSGLGGFIWVANAGLNLWDVQILDNTFRDIVYGIGVYAIRIVGQDTFNNRLTIKRNKFLNNFQNAIRYGGADGVISDNQFTDCNGIGDTTGVLCVGSRFGSENTNVTNCRIIGNQFEQTGFFSGTTGIVVYASASSNSIWGNEISRNFQGAIHNLGVGTLTTPVNVLGSGAMLYSDTNSRLARVTVGANLAFDSSTGTLTGSGGSGSLVTNANQFGASTTLTIKNGAAFTNSIERGVLQLVESLYQDSGGTNINIFSASNIFSGFLQYAAGSPGVGKVLTSDATGNASWQAGGSGGGAFGSDGWVQYANNGTNKAEAAFSYDESDNSLSVSSIIAQAFIVLPNAGLGKVLTSDASGVGTWQAGSIGASSSNFPVANFNSGRGLSAAWKMFATGQPMTIGWFGDSLADSTLADFCSRSFSNGISCLGGIGRTVNGWFSIYTTNAENTASTTGTSYGGPPWGVVILSNAVSRYVVTSANSNNIYGNRWGVLYFRGPDQGTFLVQTGAVAAWTTFTTVDASVGTGWAWTNWVVPAQSNRLMVVCQTTNMIGGAELRLITNSRPGFALAYCGLGGLQMHQVVTNADLRTVMAPYNLSLSFATWHEPSWYWTNYDQIETNYYQAASPGGSFVYETTIPSTDWAWENGSINGNAAARVMADKYGRYLLDVYAMVGGTNSATVEGFNASSGDVHTTVLGNTYITDFFIRQSGFPPNVSSNMGMMGIGTSMYPDIIAGPGSLIDTQYVKGLRTYTIGVTNVPLANISTNGALNAQVPTFNGTSIAWSNTAAGGGAAQTPWAQTINAAGNELTNVSHVSLGATTFNGPTNTQNATLQIAGTNSLGQRVIFQWRCTNSTLIMESSVNEAAFTAQFIYGTTPGITTFPSNFGLGGNGGIGGVTSLAMNGSLTGHKIANVTKVANYSVTTSEGGWSFNNIGSSIATTNTLPSATAGFQVSFYVDAAQVLCVKGAGSDIIRYGSTVSAAAGEIYSSAIGSTIHLFCPKSGVWIADTLTGTWNGPN